MGLCVNNTSIKTAIAGGVQGTKMKEYQNFTRKLS